MFAENGVSAFAVGSKLKIWTETKTEIKMTHAKTQMMTHVTLIRNFLKNIFYTEVLGLYVKV